MLDGKEVFIVWSQLSDKTEQKRCERFERTMKQAVAVVITIRKKVIRAFLQGVYQNRANERQDSDIDVCVLCEEVFFHDPRPCLFSTSIGAVPTTCQFSHNRIDVE